MVECMNPTGYRLEGQRTHAMRIAPGEVTLSCEIYFPEDQVFTQAFVFLKDLEPPDVYTAALRWIGRQELAEMGEKADLTLTEIWKNWDGTPAGESTPMCIHVFQKREAN